MCFYFGRHEEFKDFFSQEGGVVFCNDVCSVMEVLGHEFIPDQWRLFIDSSNVNLKVVLIHNGNRFPSVHLAYAANMKESYESNKLLLGKVKYDEFKSKLCGDPKLWHCYLESSSVTKILLFPLRVGQPGKEETILK